MTSRKFRTITPQLWRYLNFRYNKAQQQNTSKPKKKKEGKPKSPFPQPQNTFYWPKKNPKTTSRSAKVLEFFLSPPNLKAFAAWWMLTHGGWILWAEVPTFVRYGYNVWFYCVLLPQSWGYQQQRHRFNRCIRSSHGLMCQYTCMSYMIV